jgi:hypothetical protein
MTLHNIGRSLVLLRHGLRRKEKQHSLDSGIFHYFLSLSLSLPLYVPLSFSDVGKEVRREQWIVRRDVGVHEGDHQL